MANINYKNGKLNIKISPANGKRYRKIFGGETAISTPDSFLYLGSRDAFSSAKNGIRKTLWDYKDKHITFKTKSDLVERFAKHIGMKLPDVELILENDYFLGDDVSIAFVERSSTKQFSMKIDKQRDISKQKVFLEQMFIPDKSVVVLDLINNIFDIEFSNENWEFGKIEGTDFKEGIWFNKKEYIGITRKIAAIVYNEIGECKTGDYNDHFKDVFNLEVESMMHLYSFRDNTTSWFDHLTHNSRNTLMKNGLIVKDGDKYKKTESLNEAYVDPLREIVGKFINELREQSGFDTKTKKEVRIVSRKTKMLTSQEIESKKEVIRERGKFRKALHTNFKDLKEFIKNHDISTFTNKDFIFPEAAHIVSVKFLYVNDRIDEISNRYNGLLLDPNTHTLFDKKFIYINDKYEFRFVNDDKLHSTIRKDLITPEREKYLKEHISLFKSGAI